MVHRPTHVVFADPPEVLHEQGPVFFLRFPNFSMEYPEGSHPAEIMELCRKKVLHSLLD